jgi:hypothetical protein
MALLDSFFGNQTPLGPKPDYQEFAMLDGDPDMTDKEYAAWQQAVEDWEEKKGQIAERKSIFQKMAQKVGPTPAPFKTRMGTREAPPNMMTSLFPSKFGPAGAGRVDILAPEVESIEDIYRKKPNMFRMV